MISARFRSLFFFFSSALAVGIYPASSSAYCTFGSVTFRDTSGNVMTEIPVYVNTGMWNIARTGLSQEAAINVVKSAITGLNEAGVTHPRRHHNR